MSGEASATTQRDVLEAARERMIAAVDAITENIIHISDSDEPPAGLNNYFWVAIWPLGGMFDEGAFLGGGKETLFENAGLSISVYRKNRLDQVGDASELLLGTDPIALLDLKRDILKALAGHRLESDQAFILIEEMRPIRSDNPRVNPDESGRIADIYLEFTTYFHWDLA